MNDVSKHGITRVRRELAVRACTVLRTELLTPLMRRIVLGGAELAGFESSGFDDHVKLFLPPGAGAPLVLPTAGANGAVHAADAVRPIARDYTPRHYDPVRNELSIDMALHGHGPASAWAVRAAVGDPVGVGGPRGSALVSETFDWWLMAGDESALPAIARRLETCPAQLRVFVVAEVADALEEQPLRSLAAVRTVWVHRRAGDAELLRAVAALELPAGDGFAWVACESASAKALRAHLVGERGLNPRWVKAASYWRSGAAAVHETFAD